MRTQDSHCLLGLAKEILQAESIREAAQEVVDEWEKGFLINKPDYYSGSIAIALLRTALDGQMNPDIMDRIKGKEV